MRARRSAFQSPSAKEPAISIMAAAVERPLSNPRMELRGAALAAPALRR